MKAKFLFRTMIFTPLLAITLAGSFAFAEFSSADGKKVSLLSTENKSDEMTVLWWNVACYSPYDLGQKKQLLQNIEELAKHENQVDVLIFGEDCTDQIPAELLAKLQARYPTRAFFPYEINNPETQKAGISVFTRHEIAVGASEALDWVSGRASEEDRMLARNYWGPNIPGIHTRSYAPIKILKENKVYRLLPVHLIHPWHAYLSKWFPGEPQTAKLAIVKELLFGKENPLIWQLEHLISKLQRDFASTQYQRLMLVGDFNFPTSIGLSTEAYKRIRQLGLYDGMGVSTRTQKDVNLKIDHVFLNRSLETTRASVLPLNGSDHFPIFVRVR